MTSLSSFPKPGKDFFSPVLSMAESAKILGATSEGLAEAVNLLKRGKVVAIPTETVYGLAANALDPVASQQVFEIKGRPLIDPLIVHLEGIDKADSFAHISPEAQILAQNLWPGPLTMVLRKKNSIPDLITAGLPSVAIRAPANPIARRILEQLDFPLAAPSANPFGYLSPTRAEHVVDTLGSLVAAVVEGGTSLHGVESTILDMREPNRIKILRPGPIDADTIEAILDHPVERFPEGTKNSAEPQTAPGMLSKHYSPRARIILVPHGRESERYHQICTPTSPLVLNRRPRNLHIKPGLYWLSEDGSSEECARNLFALLHKLDRPEIQQITVELAPEEGIGHAINDRLSRAAAP